MFRLERFSLGLSTAEENGDQLPARWTLVSGWQTWAAGCLSPFFRGPKGSLGLCVSGERPMVGPVASGVRRPKPWGRIPCHTQVSAPDLLHIDVKGCALFLIDSDRHAG